MTSEMARPAAGAGDSVDGRQPEVFDGVRRILPCATRPRRRRGSPSRTGERLLQRVMGLVGEQVRHCTPSSTGSRKNGPKRLHMVRP